MTAETTINIRSDDAVVESAADRFADAAFAAVNQPTVENRDRDRSRTADIRGGDRDRDISRNRSR